MRILFVFLHGIGDCLMFTPALRMYKEEHKSDIFDILTLDLTKEIWQNNPNINTVFVSKFIKSPPNHGNYLKYFFQRIKIKNEINEIKKRFNYNRVEYVVPQSFRIFGLTIPIPGLLNRTILKKFDKHETVKLCRRLNVGKDKKWPDAFFKELNIPSRNIKNAESLLKKSNVNGKFYVLHTTAFARNRKLTKDESIQLINLLYNNKIKVIVLQKEDQNKDTIYIKTQDLMTSAAIIKKCSLFVGIDSGPAHIAEALKKRSVIISKAFKGSLRYIETKSFKLIDKFDIALIKKDINEKR